MLFDMYLFIYLLIYLFIFIYIYIYIYMLTDVKDQHHTWNHKFIKSKSHKIINLCFPWNLSLFSFYRSFFKQSQHFEHKPCKADMVNFQASTLFICISMASMLLAFLNLSVKIFQILGPRNNLRSMIHCPYWRYGELGIIS